MDKELERLQMLLLKRQNLEHVKELVQQELNYWKEADFTTFPRVKNTNDNDISLVTHNDDRDAFQCTPTVQHKILVATTSTVNLRNTSPLENEYILQMIFSFCSVPTLKNIRLVSTDWNDLSMKTWRTKAVLCLNCCNRKKPEMSLKGLPLEFQTFLKIMNSSDEDPLQLRKYPFQSYSLNFGKCYIFQQKLPRIRPSKPVKQLVQTISSFTRYLRICNTDVSLEEFLRTYLSEMPLLRSLEMNSVQEQRTNFLIQAYSTSEELPLFPRLKSLKICHTKYSLKNTREWKQLFKRLPGLESLTIGFSFGPDSWTVEREIIRIIEAVKETRDAQKGNLKELNLEMAYITGISTCDGICDLLIDCNFPLERLSLALEYSHQIDCALRLLNHMKNTLLQVEISCPGSFENKTKTVKLFPHKTKITIDNLTHLILANGVVCGMRLLMHLDLPCLKKLVVKSRRRPFWLPTEDPYAMEHFHIHFAKGSKFEALGQFEMLVKDKVLPIKTLRCFANLMPNLTHLTIPLDKKAFGIICECFGKLKTLNVLAARSDYEDIDDEALTGFSSRCSGRSRGPNITYLKNLTVLKISCSRQLKRKDVKFTDDSVTYGLLELPNLHYLSMAFRKLSKNTMETLVKHVQGTIHFQNAEMQSEQFDDHYTMYPDCDLEIDVDYDVNQHQDDVEAVQFSIDEDFSEDDRLFDSD